MHPDFILAEGYRLPRKASAVQDKRFRQRCPVTIPCQFVTEQGKLDGYVRNLSIGGAFVQADAAQRMGTIGELRFEHAGELKIVSRVVHGSSWSSGPKRIEGFGLCFTSFADQSRRRLRDLMRELLAR